MSETAEGVALPHEEDDEKRLAELGYRQDLERKMSGFANFAISFTIISVLSGALTLYYQGINYGGFMQQSIGWPIVSLFVLIVAMSMAELASAYPTAGGLYWWASRLGGPVWGWFTGWFNLIGQIAITAGIDYGAATFTTALLNFWFGYSNDPHHIIYTYIAILALHATLNIFGVRLVARLNDISAYWHVLGVAIIGLVLIVIPDHHNSVSDVFTTTVNNSGLSGVGIFFIFLLGFLQAQYTYTGYDASAHMSEETRGASRAAARGVVNSVLVSAIAGYVLIMALTFGIKDVGAVSAAGTGAAIEAMRQGVGQTAMEWLLFIAVMGQLFCGMSAVTSASRMLFAFSRDRAVPGHQLWSKLNGRHVPANAVMLICFLAFVLASPAWSSETTFVYAAVTSVATIGLYIAYILPVYLRLRKGDDFDPGPWSLGRWYKPLNIIAIIWVIFICILFIMPLTDAAVPWNDAFDHKAFNYAPVAVGVVALAVTIWWHLSAKHWFKGPIRNVDELPPDPREGGPQQPPEPGPPEPQPAVT
jgi:amino acid transporter